MATPAPTSTARRLLWSLTALLALAGIVLLALGMTGSSGRVSSDMVGFHAGDRVDVPETGMSVWSRTPDSRTEVICLLDDTPLLRPVEDFSVEVADQPFHETARTPQDLPAGTYVLECLPEGATGEASGAAADDAGAEAGGDAAEGDAAGGEAAGADAAGVDPLYIGPYGPGALSTGLLGGTGVTLGLVLLPLALICGLLAWAAGRREPEEAESGPDPAAYTMSEQREQTAYNSPYATPQADPYAAYGQASGPGTPYGQASGPGAPYGQASGSGTPYGQAPGSGTPYGSAPGPGGPTSEPAPFPTGGPFTGALPPRPESTGHDETDHEPEGRPPSGPRYDLPPPS